MTDLPGWFASVLAAVIPGYGDDPGRLWNGYIEADYHYAAPLSPGRITAIPVQEGQKVEAGEVLMLLDDRAERATLAEAEARVAQAAANLQDLQTGKRKDEIDVIRASLDKAKAVQAQQKINFDRSETLLARNVISLSQWQSDRAALDAADAAVAELQAQLRVAELPARGAEREAAEQALKAAQAAQDSARIALDERQVRAPITGLIDDIYFQEGDVAATGAPSIAIYAPDVMKAIFFIPERERATVAVGQTLALTCDSCPPGLSARVTRLSADPQFTPPIIYSREERNRLVFRAEAISDQPLSLLPGQPVTLEPLVQESAP
ncbi:HlyD family secretion protein [Neotabrizicola shimadae]|uniref:HlyD family efflux transporter periplasmic adaptor subunit n=1 Tax=Neotabrizicola shimadae TaxID=2807096 RepID=A0A8G0ZYT3_9RHOB|nr:HlyD family efflux transporter periplasmic adaptor subunit [Neotabrizicola shimadae]QYZ70719.1 HlyD family efflux transporter periplasmic adaptor subunit [Neotabrizicola shimadae]